MSSGAAPTGVAGPARPSNRVGVLGLCVAVLGAHVLAVLSVAYFLDWPLLRGLTAWQVVAAGALSPLGLLISVLGIFRVSKGAATGGVVLGMLGTLYLAGAGTLLVADQMELFTPPAEREQRRAERTVAAVEQATAKIAQHVAVSGTAPSTEEGRRMIAGFVDGWGRSIHYFKEEGPDRKAFLVTSAGPDGEFGNPDDVTNKSLARERQQAEDAAAEELLDDVMGAP